MWQHAFVLPPHSLIPAAWLGGGKKALIIHPQSLANYCLLTGNDKPVATTGVGGGNPVGGADPHGWGKDFGKKNPNLKICFSHVTM